jgi:hypothetical protein
MDYAIVMRSVRIDNQGFGVDIKIVLRQIWTKGADLSEPGGRNRLLNTSILSSYS